jgi:hypothetical protein
MRAVPVFIVFHMLAATPALAADPCGPGHMRKAEVRGGVLELVWHGTIIEQMAGTLPTNSPGTSATHPREATARMQIRSPATEEVLSRCFSGAALSEDWLRYLRRTLRTNDLWQSGRDIGNLRVASLLRPSPNGTACSLECRG